jgi:dipeptidyl aminopeptidase/acylaminoacyl peptidase/actin-like ATPase involved in cell morphogenesis
VDLGTTYTAAAILRDGRAEVASLGTRTLEIPSVVLLRDDGVLLIGEPAERRSLTEPGRFAREFKRRIGDPTPILLGGAPFSAHALMAHLLRGVVGMVADREGEPAAHTVVTCPANWGDYKRELLDQVITQADIGPASVATEPEAAAVHYASTTRVAPGEIVAVYDLGGGTFDAAVLRNAGSTFELIGDPRGIEQLGGVYFDEAVFTWVVQHLPEAFGQLDPDDPVTVTAVSRLRRECVEAKETLSWDTDATIAVVLPNQRTEIRITRAELEDLIRPALADTVEAMRRALLSAEVQPTELTSVLLVGGSSRIPLVGQVLMSDLGRPIAIDVHPKHAVALGAALLSAQAASPVASAAAGVATMVPPTVTRVGPAGAALAPAAPAGPPGAPDAPLGSPAATAPPSPRPSHPARPDEAPPEPLEAERPRRRTPLVVGAAVAAVVVAAAVGVALTGGGGDGEQGAQTSDTTSTTTALVAAGTIAPVEVPEGPPLGPDVMAFTRKDGTFWNVWLIGADGSDPRALTREQAAFPRLPVLAPDRRSVVFSMEVGPDWQLRVIDTNGDGDRLVADDIVPDARATWSPDGTRLAFVSDKDGPSDVYILELATGKLSNLTDSPEDDGDPAWSPDGRSIAYWSRVGGNQDLYVIPAVGGDARRLTTDPADDADPAWRPGGKALAYAAQPGGSWEIFTMTAEGTGRRQLTDNDTDDQDPSWSSDGRQIAFESKRDAPDRPDFADLYVMAADGTGQHNITNREGLDIHPAWGTPPGDGDGDS